MLTFKDRVNFFLPKQEKLELLDYTPLIAEQMKNADELVVNSENDNKPKRS